MSRRQERLGLRARETLATYRPAILVVCLLLAAVGGVATHTAYVAGATETTEETAARWTTSGSFDHSATVTRENPLFRVGRVLPDQRAYFQRITPVVNGTYRFQYGADTGSVSAETRATLVVESVDDDTVFWQRTSRLGQFSQSDVPPGRAVELPFSVNISRTAGLIDRVRETVGRSPGDVRVVVRTTTTYEGQIGDRDVRRSRSDELVFRPGEAAFRVGDTTGGESQVRVTTTVTRPVEYGPPRRVGGPLALVVGLLAAGLVAALDPDRLALSATERRRLRFLTHRREYAEWLSAFQPPATASEPPVAEAETLADLVDFAIDSDNGVLYDRSRDRYVVVDGETTYVYQPPAGVERQPLRSLLDDRIAAVLGGSEPSAPDDAGRTDSPETRPEDPDE